MARVPASRQSILNLMRMSHSSGCPCHGCSSLRNSALSSVRAGLNMVAGHNAQAGSTRRGYATPVDAQLEKEYAFELAASNIRFGEGVTKEVGMDFQNLGARKVGVFTDPTIKDLTPMRQSIEGLEAQGIKYEVFDRVRVEPNDER